MLPSPAWNTLLIAIPYRCPISSIARNVRAFAERFNYAPQLYAPSAAALDSSIVLVFQKKSDDLFQNFFTEHIIFSNERLKLITGPNSIQLKTIQKYRRRTSDAMFAPGLDIGIDVG